MIKQQKQREKIKRSERSFQRRHCATFSGWAPVTSPLTENFVFHHWHIAHSGVSQSTDTQPHWHAQRHTYGQLVNCTYKSTQIHIGCKKSLHPNQTECKDWLVLIWLGQDVLLKLTDSTAAVLVLVVDSVPQSYCHTVVCFSWLCHTHKKTVRV